MTVDIGTFLLSLALDAVLCGAVAAALTRALPSFSDALWNWSGAMLCLATAFALARLAALGGAANLALTELLPHCFGVVGAASVLSASRSLNGRRRQGGAAWAALAVVAAIWATLYWPGLWRARGAAAFGAMAIFLGMAAHAFATERRWRSQLGGWLAIASLSAMGLGWAGLALAFCFVDSMAHPALAPLLFGMEAVFLASSFAFILAGAELARSQAVEASMRDSLTGLLTKRGFYELCASALAKARRDKEPCAVLMLDIDHFKQVNDTRGHLAGDSAIVHVGALMAQALRASDISARFGGDEFCALLPRTDAEGARQVAERILASARSHPARHPQANPPGFFEMPLTVSIGVQCRADGAVEGTAELLDQADAALYAAKKAGRDRLDLRVGRP